MNIRQLGEETIRLQDKRIAQLEAALKAAEISLENTHEFAEALEARLAEYQNPPPGFIYGDPETIKKYADAANALKAAQEVVDEQSEDEGLWFDAKTAPEAYLQQEMRRLHAAIDAARREGK